MPARRHVALLRGINVGGRNPVAMADLRGALEAAGYEAVSTYIQSGNVLFRSTTPAAQIEAHVEVLLERHLGFPLVVVVRSHAQLRAVVRHAPAGFGDAPDTYFSDVVFLKGPLTTTEAMGVVGLREGVDQAWPGRGVVYFARLGAERTRSKLSQIIAKPEYQLMTIRSWTTTTKLLAMLDDG